MLINRAASGTSEKTKRKPHKRVPPDRPDPVNGRTQRRRIIATRREAHLWRLRLSVLGALVLLIVMTASGFQTTERMLDRQKSLDSAYRTHILFTDLDSIVRSARVSAAAYIQDGDKERRIEAQLSLSEAHKLVKEIQPRSSVLLLSDRERYTDLLPRSSLYIKTLEDGIGQRRAGNTQEALRTLSSSTFDYAHLLQMAVRLRSDQESQLRRLNQEIEEAAEKERNKTWISTSLAVVLLGVAGLFFSRDLRVRTRQEQALRSANRTLTRLAEQDGLTRLKNRRALEEELHSEWAHSRRSHKPLSLLFVDVDKFKEYNDTFGHQAGDDALKQVADLLRREERLSGSCVARYGGEEFALVLPRAGIEESRQVGERVRASFESAVWRGRPVTASVGAATICQGEGRRFSDVETLLYEADGALYHAKREGRNQVTHSSDLFPLPAAPVLPLRSTMR